MQLKKHSFEFFKLGRQAGSDALNGAHYTLQLNFIKMPHRSAIIFQTPHRGGCYVDICLSLIILVAHQVNACEVCLLI